ncbi:MAG: NAD(P)H-dependent glycerol-3-phosphate dehydrogenase [Ruminococcaceae bacterium]|nr:NAD(P)H-dependent glycerol-3-phosphate dehydrogenase [Oscillospiraceae bacterium]
MEKIKNITVIGCGRWGTFIASHLSNAGFTVTLYGRESSKNMQELIATRKNALMRLPDTLHLSTDLKAALKDCDVLVISIASQQLRALCGELRAAGFTKGTVVLCMKGLEIGTGKRLSTIVEEELSEDINTAVWLGPGHVQDFCRGIPNCMVIDSTNEQTKRLLVDAFSGRLIRFYYGQDMIGNEIGAAAKNVVGIAAGLLDGISLSPLKGALMSRGTREIARLIAALGGNEQSAWGLCHLGDYEATVFSPHSHNRAFGEAFAKGEAFDALAEGYYTVRALNILAEKYLVELPICHTVEAVLYHGAHVREALFSLFERSIKNEF